MSQGFQVSLEGAHGAAQGTGRAQWRGHAGAGHKGSR